MREHIHRENRYTSESGIFYGLLAASILSILLLAIVLYVNPYVAKRASLELRARADAICGSLVVGDTELQGRMLGSFVSQLKAMQAIEPSNLVKLTRARLVVPTMPVEGSIFNLLSASTPTDTFFAPGGGATSTHSTNFSGLPANAVSGINCSGGNLPSGMLCEVQTNVYWPPNASAGHKYPNDLWNNMDNAGNTVACELEAEVSLFFGVGTLPLVARVVHQKRLQGNFKDYVGHTRTGSD